MHIYVWLILLTYNLLM